MVEKNSGWRPIMGIGGSSSPVLGCVMRIRPEKPQQMRTSMATATATGNRFTFSFFADLRPPVCPAGRDFSRGLRRFRSAKAVSSCYNLLLLYRFSLPLSSGYSAYGRVAESFACANFAGVRNTPSQRGQKMLPVFSQLPSATNQRTYFCGEVRDHERPREVKVLIELFQKFTG